MENKIEQQLEINPNKSNLNRTLNDHTLKEATQHKKDSLSGWAIWAVIFVILSVTVVGGAIGGGIAGVLSFPITNALPIRSNGRRLPAVVSVFLIISAVIFFILTAPILLKR